MFPKQSLNREMNMSFFLNPFVFVLELIAFLIQAAVLYGLALIAVFGLIAYGISTMPTTEYVYVTEVVETVVPVVETVIETVCERIDGCRVWWDENGVEFCPTCVNK